MTINNFDLPGRRPRSGLAWIPPEERPGVILQVPDDHTFKAASMWVDGTSVIVAAKDFQVQFDVPSDVVIIDEYPIQRQLRQDGQVLSITDQRVLEALGDPRFDYRSAQAISRQCMLSIDEVEESLRTLLLAGLVRHPTIPIADAGSLYAVSTRSVGWRERYAKVRAFATKTRL